MCRPSAGNCGQPELTVRSSSPPLWLVGQSEGEKTKKKEKEKKSPSSVEVPRAERADEQICDLVVGSAREARAAASAANLEWRDSWTHLVPPGRGSGGGGARKRLPRGATNTTQLKRSIYPITKAQAEVSSKLALVRLLVIVIVVGGGVVLVLVLVASVPI